MELIFQVCQEEEFLQLTLQELIALIRKDELNVREEREVYNAVLNWVSSFIAYLLITKFTLYNSCMRGVASMSWNIPGMPWSQNSGYNPKSTSNRVRFQITRLPSLYKLLKT